MAKFADCKNTAITVSGFIEESKVCYGLYIPKKPKKEWATGWQNNSDEVSVFTHFWIEYENQILDLAADQFGEKGIVTTSLDDPHYIKVGYVKNSEHIPQVDDPKIKWETFKGSGSRVVVEWWDMHNYLRRHNMK